MRFLFSGGLSLGPRKFCGIRPAPVNLYKIIAYHYISFRSLTCFVVGRSGEAMFNSSTSEGIVVYSQSKGLYGGISLDFSGIIVDSTGKT